MEDQLRFLREEVDKKDDLIRELTKMNHARTITPTSFRQNGASEEKLEEIRSKVEKLQRTISENKEILHEKNTLMCELRAENESIRIESLSHMRRIEELEGVLEDDMARLADYRSAEDQHDRVLQALQSDIKSKNAKLLEIQSYTRTNETRFRDKISKDEKSLDEIRETLKDLAQLMECEDTSDACTQKLTELVRDNCSMKTQLDQRTDAIQTFEYEQRASRETIMRLSGELNREQREKETTETDAKNANEELRKLKKTYEQLENRSTMMEDRIVQLTQALHAARADSEEKDKKIAIFSGTEGRFNARLNTPKMSERTNPMDMEEVKTFLTNVSTWLAVPDKEKETDILPIVWSQIQDLLEGSKAQNLLIHDLQDQLAVMAQTDANCGLNEHYLKERIDNLETQRASDGTTIDAVRAERNQLHDQICKMAFAAKFEEPIAEIEPEILGETLLARITQLQQGDTEKQAKQRIQITRLQRELRESKERDESLELQVSILRRRLAEAQEHRFHTTTPASQTPTTLAASEKERLRLVKQLQQSKEDADRLREDIVLLKARLLDSSHDKLAQVAHCKALKATQGRVDELNRNCEEQKQEARKTRVQLESLKKRSGKELGSLHEQMIELEREVQHAKEALETSRRSEGQLLEFRALIARHLGLDCEHLSVPDYEILVQLDRLVQANQAHIANMVATERALHFVNGNYKTSQRDSPYR